MNRYNLYLIAVGTVVGTFASPWVLGRIAPEAYQRLFVGGQSVQDQLATFDQQHQKQRARIVHSGATATALNEFDRRSRPNRQLLELQLRVAQMEHANQWLGQSIAMLLAIIIVQVAEGQVKQTVRRRCLETARYAMLAVWIAMALAGPMFRDVPLILTGLLVLLTGASALVPIKESKPGNSSAYTEA